MRQILNFDARHLAGCSDRQSQTYNRHIFIIIIIYYYVCIVSTLPCRNVSGNPVDVGGPHDRDEYSTVNREYT